jgi:zinc transporter ZupT
MKKKIIIRILAVLAVLTAIASVVVYLILRGDKPWLAFYFACCGGLLVFNFLLSLFLVQKNIKDKR